MEHKTIYFIFIAYLNIILASACKNHKTCHDCITDPSLCVWCASNNTNFPENEPRCRAQSSLDPKWCADALDEPESPSNITSEKYNQDFNSSTGNIVQIKPQMYNLKLRVGQPLNFNFSFQGAKDYPVDLYILLDASKTMKTIKDNLTSYSQTIYETMRNMTKNVTIGFGTFIDKNTAPFTLLAKSKNAYSFRNKLNLTSDYKKFSAIVNHTKFGRNFDTPEGGLDALAQVIVCDVGWRNMSRRIIVLFTDNPQHTAGDGRSAGILEPYDGKCHTNEHGEYTKELDMDYPSVAMINRLASSKNSIIIFALKGPLMEPMYELLTEDIRGSKMAVISDNNMVKLLIDSYKEISTHIKLQVAVESGHNDNYEIKFDPDCTETSHSNDCKVETEQRRNFTGTITLKKYYGYDTDSINISIQGISEKLTLNVEVIKCSCEEEEAVVSSYCNKQKRQCGICICNESSHGNRCMCSKDEASPQNDTLCYAGPGKPKCSGRGDCICGYCQCHDKSRYFGSFCECDHKMCPSYNGTECGGPDQGTCICDKNDAGRVETSCLCKDDWGAMPMEKASTCSCSLRTDSCEMGERICNDRGNCTCNTCVCDDPASWDMRSKQDKLCRMQPCQDSICRSSQCNVIRTCVLCLLDSNNCENHCNGIKLEKRYEELPEEYLNSTEWVVCDNQRANMGCYTKFVYRYDNEAYSILLQMQDKTNCAENYYMYGGILLITLLLIGIFTLLAWKCLTRYQDRKEFEKFEAEHKEDLYNVCENVLYNEPTTTFRNPAFKRSFTHK